MHVYICVVFASHISMRERRKAGYGIVAQLPIYKHVIDIHEDICTYTYI